MTFRLCHLSDLHIGPLPPLGLKDFFGKRLTGYLNWTLGQRHLWHDMAVFEKLLVQIGHQKPDHVAVTGDMVNLSLAGEFRQGLEVLKSIGSPENVSFIPGNHDAYTAGAAHAALKAFGPYMASDSESAPERNEEAFPFVRRRGPIALVGLNSGIPRPPFMADGRLGDSQRRRLADWLSVLKAEGLIRVVLIHHPPFDIGWQKRLMDWRLLEAVLQEAGAELVLHGHTHKGTVREVAGVPVIGVPSASMASGTGHEAAAFNCFDFDAGHMRFRRFQWQGRDDFSLTQDRDFVL